MRKIVKFIDNLNELIGKITSILAYILLFVVVFEVIRRKVFNNPTMWAFELSYMLYAVMFLMGFGYTLKHKMHIGIDVLYSRLSKKIQGILDLITFFIFFIPFTLVAIKSSWIFMLQSWQGLEHSQSPWAPPIYPFKTFMPIAFILLLLQGISEAIKSYYKIKGEEL
ncbi:TRAP transporter small permease subunit [Deferribacter thermophilus]|uniref:TRAP transporter small permease subunit n=1 Tax=Deferribacter thermophilus TaxID=53573 RepID=UPI003C26DBA1